MFFSVEDYYYKPPHNYISICIILKYKSWHFLPVNTGCPVRLVLSVKTLHPNTDPVAVSPLHGSRVVLDNVQHNAAVGLIPINTIEYWHMYNPISIKSDHGHEPIEA